MRRSWFLIRCLMVRCCCSWGTCHVGCDRTWWTSLSSISCHLGFHGSEPTATTRAAASAPEISGAGRDVATDLSSPFLASRAMPRERSAAPGRRAAGGPACELPLPAAGGFLSSCACRRGSAGQARLPGSMPTGSDQGSISCSVSCIALARRFARGCTLGAPSQASKCHLRRSTASPVMARRDLTRRRSNMQELRRLQWQMILIVCGLHGAGRREPPPHARFTKRACPRHEHMSQMSPRRGSLGTVGTSSRQNRFASGHARQANSRAPDP